MLSYRNLAGRVELTNRAMVTPEETLSCAGVPVSSLTPKEACALLVECGVNGPVGPMDVHLCNAYTLALADRSPEYREILRESALNRSEEHTSELQSLRHP